MARGILIIIGLALIGLAATLFGTYACAYIWNAKSTACLAIEIMHTWQTLISGLIALVAAGATVLAIMRQVKQTEEHRKVDWRRKAGSIANTLYIDLWDTSDRLRAIGYVQELDPPMSETSRAMITDATMISPVLATAVQKHCIELARLSQRMKKDGTILGEIPTNYRREKYEVAYRARVLAWCFSEACLQIQQTGFARGPYITQAKLSEIEKAFAVGEVDRDYLRNVLRITGIG